VDAVFAAAGTGTSVGLHVGSGKVLKVGGSIDTDASTALTIKTVGTTAVTVSTTQNVGVGLTPAGWVTFKAVELTGGAIAGIGTNQFDVVQNAYYDGAFKYKTTGGATFYQQTSSSHSWYNAPSGTADAAITFTQAMTLDSSGHLLVGTTSTGGKLTVSESNAAIIATSISATSASQSTQVLQVKCARGATTAYNLIQGQNNSTTECFKVDGAGDVKNTNNSYGAISDIKVKENIIDATPKLADMMQVKVRNYNLIGSTTKQIGVIAQELETVFPLMIDETPDRDAEGNDLGTTTKGVKYSVFVPMLIKAIQEQQALITALTTRITALEGA
jgi:hypothetical protein